MRRWVRSLALVGLGAAFGAFGALPLLHQIGHEDDHDHIGGAIVHRGPRADHTPEGGHDEDPAPAHPEDRPSDGEDAPNTPRTPWSHGAGSLSHFGAPIVAPASAPPIDPPAARAAGETVPADRPLVSIASRAHRARAPPASR